mmetsp:Transcript_81380/g.128282  ORF Transcript_81380/g.128282 Transcript_81380/m.128282 type:complete len:205 (-) Transcript_81380:95-709(-)
MHYDTLEEASACRKPSHGEHLHNKVASARQAEKCSKGQLRLGHCVGFAAAISYKETVIPRLANHLDGLRDRRTILCVIRINILNGQRHRIVCAWHVFNLDLKRCWSDTVFGWSNHCCGSLVVLATYGHNIGTVTIRSDAMGSDLTHASVEHEWHGWWLQSAKYVDYQTRRLQVFAINTSPLVVDHEPQRSTLNRNQSIGHHRST